MAHSPATIPLPKSIRFGEAKLFLAIKFVEVGRLSCTHAAEYTGCSKREFVEQLGRHSLEPIARAITLGYAAARQTNQRSHRGEDRCFDLVGRAIAQINPDARPTMQEIITAAKAIGAREGRNTSNMYATYHDFINHLVDELGAVRHDDTEPRTYRLESNNEVAGHP